MARYSFAQVRNLAEYIVGQNPDFVYRSTPLVGCAYGDSNGLPSCLVGHIVAALDPAAFKRLASNWNFSGVGGACAIWEMFDFRTVAFLAELQLRQDRRETWYDALKGAERHDVHYAESLAYDDLED